jgi:hypothetical protein
MNLAKIASIIDSTTAELKADNDRAALLATDPWPYMAKVMRDRADARHHVDALFQQLRKAQAERNSGENS